MPFEPYTLEQAEDDIAYLRQQVDLLTEILNVNDITVGQVPNTPTLGLSHYSSLGQHKYVSDDGNAYNTGRITLNPSTNQVINSASLTAVGGMSCSLAANVEYRIHGAFFTVPALAGASEQWAFAQSGGLTFSSSRYAYREFQCTSPMLLGNAAFITGTNTFTGIVIPGTTPNMLTVIDGYISVATSGTITLEAATTNATDTFTIDLIGTYLEFCPVS